MISSEETNETFLLSLTGGKLTSIERHEFSWSFNFGSAASLVIEGPWRIVTEGGVSLSSLDDEQKFGLSDPIDARTRAIHLILGRTIHDAAVRKDTGDLTISFREGLALEALSLSSGYETWQLSKPEAGMLVCAGGGRLVFA